MTTSTPTIPTLATLALETAATAPNPNQALWEKGDFTKLAESMRESGDAFVAGLQVARGTRVLDVGCGDGTTAIPLAQRGASVLGIDIARNLVEAGNRRARDLGLSNVHIQHGDAASMVIVADESIDLTVSVFGAMFSPRPHDVARELVRVTRPGGRIVMGNWIPGDPTLVAQILRISSAYSPPPPAGFVSPMTWGVEAQVVERFGAAGIPESNVSFARETFTFRLPTAPVTMLERFRNYYGPTMNAFEAATREGRANDLWAELSALFEAQNRGGRDATEIPATFLKVTVQKS